MGKIWIAPLFTGDFGERLPGEGGAKGGDYMKPGFYGATVTKVSLRPTAWDVEWRCLCGKVNTDSGVRQGLSVRCRKCKVKYGLACWLRWDVSLRVVRK